MSHTANCMNIYNCHYVSITEAGATKCLSADTEIMTQPLTINCLISREKYKAQTTVSHNTCV